MCDVSLPSSSRWLLLRRSWNVSRTSSSFPYYIVKRDLTLRRCLALICWWLVFGPLAREPRDETYSMMYLLFSLLLSSLDWSVGELVSSSSVGPSHKRRRPEGRDERDGKKCRIALVMKETLVFLRFHRLDRATGSLSLSLAPLGNDEEIN